MSHPHLTWIHEPKQGRSRRTLEALLDAAERLLAERSFDEVTVQALTKRAGCSVGAFYGRFGTKQDLLRALYSRYASRSRATLAAFGQPEAWVGVPLSEVVAALTSFLVEDYRTQAGLRRVFLEALPADSSLRDMASALTHETCAAFHALVSARAAEHAHPDPALAAVACHRVVFGALDQDLAFGGPDPVGPVLSAGDLQQSLMHAVLGILGTAP